MVLMITVRSNSLEECMCSCHGPLVPDILESRSIGLLCSFFFEGYLSLSKVMAKESELLKTLGCPSSHFFIYPFKRCRIGGPFISVLLQIFPREDNKKNEGIGVIYFSTKEYI